MGKVAHKIFDAQVEKIRKTYSHRRDRMLEAMSKYMPAGVEWTKPEGGMFVWVTLPKGFDGASLLAKAIRDHRIAFVPGKAFHADGTGENTIRLSFSCASDDAIETGISRLGTLIKGEMAS